jgi:acyl-CoA synthetase (AMP-forming)/AMP-acid ligase II
MTNATDLLPACRIKELINCTLSIQHMLHINQPVDSYTFHSTGRIKELINRGGEKISPIEANGCSF